MEEPRPARLLFLLVDVVGYSKLGSVEELATVKLLADVWAECSLAAADGVSDALGAPISIGDGFIFSGEDSSLVASAFFDYIRLVSRRIANLESKRQFSVRFALHAGEGWLLNNNILGHPVNDISRIGACARSGQILASRTFWTRLRAFEDAGDLSVRSIMGRLHFDVYLVRFKHDHWTYQDLEPLIRTARTEDRTVHNLMLEPASGESAQLGCALPPENAVRFTGHNNYHHAHQLQGAGFVLCPEAELFRRHSSELNRRLMCSAFRHTFVRLPYLVEFIAAAGSRVLLVESPRIPPDVMSGNPLHLKLRRAYEARRALPASGLQRATLLGVKEIQAFVSDDAIRVILLTQKCNYSAVLTHSLAPDWAPQNAQAAATSARQGADASGDSLWRRLSVGGSRVCVLARTKCGHVLSPSLQAPHGAVVCEPSPQTYIRWSEGAGESRETERVFDRRPATADRAALRCCKESFGVDAGDVRSAVLLGIARNLQHLGATEFYYLFDLDLDVNQLESVAEAHEWRKLILPSPDAAHMLELLADVMSSETQDLETRAAAFFLMAHALGKDAPGPLGTGGQEWFVASSRSHTRDLSDPSRGA